MSADTIGLAILLAGVLLLVGKAMRLAWKPAQKLFLPASVLGGFIGLLLGPSALGALVRATAGEDSPLASGLVPQPVVDVWSELPGLLINVVFATLLMGVTIPRLRTVWQLGGPQLAFGLTMGSGQYVVGLLLAVLLLAPVFGAPLMAGALIEIGFEGGHGTAGGLQETFQEVGWAEGGDLAIGMATWGIVAGIVIGIVFVNWAARTGRAAVLDSKVSDVDKATLRGIHPPPSEQRPPTGRQTTRVDSIETLSVHFALVAVAVLLAIGILAALQWVERTLFGSDFLSDVPLFPITMIGGVVVTALLQRFDRFELLDRATMVRIQGLALDVLIATAIATLSLQVLAGNAGTFFLLALTGTVWNVFCLFVLARRMIPRFWVERAAGDFGQSMGVTATGLILMNMADPDNETPAYEAFGYKQLAFEPFFGGGLVTGLAIPFVNEAGPWPLLGIMAALLAVGLATGLLYFGRMSPEEAEGRVASTRRQPASTS